MKPIISDIVTRKRSSDWIAYIKDSIEKWEAGATEDEAVRKLCRSRNLSTSSRISNENYPDTIYYLRP